MSETANNQRSLPARIFSLETLLGLAGLGLLGGGAFLGSVLGVFWGVVVLGGLVLLHLVRKKDWQKHWAEMEQEKGHRQ
jgi:hypothetical protein